MITKYLQPDENNTFLNLINKLSLIGSVIGGIYESQIHFRLLNESNLFFESFSNFNIYYKNNLGYNINNLDQFKDSIRFDSKLQVFFLNYNDIASLIPKKYYGLPLKQNYDAIDSIIQPNIMVQITKNDSHNKGISLYEKSFNYLFEKDKKKLILIFITPKNISFKFDRNLKDINQFHLTLDPIKNNNL